MSIGYKEFLKRIFVFRYFRLLLVWLGCVIVTSRTSEMNFNCMFSPSNTELSVIFGRLIDKSIDKPAAYIDIILAKKLDLSSDLSVFGVDLRQAYRTRTDNHGDFLFYGVSPGVYMIVIEHPLGLFPARDDQKSPFVINVSPNKIINSGTLHLYIP